MDAALVTAAGCLLLPLFFAGHQPELALPGGNHITLGLSQRNILLFFLALGGRLCLGSSWLVRTCGRLSPAAAATHISCIRRGATLAVTEMLPWKPIKIVDTQVMSSPL